MFWLSFQHKSSQPVSHCFIITSIIINSYFLHPLSISLLFAMRAKRSSAMRFLLCSSVVLTASAAVIRTPLQRRLEECQLDIQDGMADDPDRVNTDGTAGIGAEFESPDFRLTKSGCSADDTNAAKRKVIAERTGTNWELTADSVNEAGALQAEYIIDGVKVKVGSTDDATNGAKVAAAMAQDLVGAAQQTRDESC